LEYNLPDNIVFAVNDFSKAVGVLKVFPSVQVVTYKSASTDIAKDERVFTVEAGKNTKTIDLLKNREVTAFLKGKRVVVFKNLPAIEIYAKNNSIEVLNSDWKISFELEDKLKAAEFFKEANANQPKYFVEKVNALNYEEVRDKLGKTFVMQFARGMAGSSTYLIRNAEVLNQLKKNYFNFKAKVSEFIEGETWTLNAVCKRNPVIGKPFRQLSGDLKFNNYWGGTFGNDFTVFLPYEIESKIFEEAEIIAKNMYKKGFWGFFGLDFVVSKSGHFFIEINPRFTASVSLYSFMEEKSGLKPLFYHHLKEALGQDAAGENDRLETAFEYSQIFLRNLRDSELIVRKKSGLYDDDLSFIFETVDYNALSGDKEILAIIDGGKEIKKDIQYANLIVKSSVLNNDKTKNKIDGIIKILR